MKNEESLTDGEMMRNTEVKIQHFSEAMILCYVHIWMEKAMQLKTI